MFEQTPMDEDFVLDIQTSGIGYSFQLTWMGSPFIAIN